MARRKRQDVKEMAVETVAGDAARPDTPTPVKIEPDPTAEAELNNPEDVEQSETEAPEPEPESEPEPEPKQSAPKPDKINAVVKCCFIETSDGISAKRGETIEISTDPKKHSPALANAINNGTVVVDLAPVVSEDVD